mgnify:CR=1 FL=1
MQIKNGKIDGDKISFTVDLDFGGMPFTLAYAGVVMSDQIKLMIDFMGMPIDLVVKKAKLTASLEEAVDLIRSGCNCIPARASCSPRHVEVWTGRLYRESS